METILVIFKVIATISVVFSVLFVAARIHAGYIRKVDDECSEDCSCQFWNTPERAINEQITDSVTVAKPERKPAKKRVSAIKNDKLVITPVEENPKRGRKKQS